MSNKEQYDKEYFENDCFLDKNIFKSNTNDWLAEIYKRNMRNTFGYQAGYVGFLLNKILWEIAEKFSNLLNKIISLW